MAKKIIMKKKMNWRLITNLLLSPGGPASANRRGRTGLRRWLRLLAVYRVHALPGPSPPGVTRRAEAPGPPATTSRAATRRRDEQPRPGLRESRRSPSDSARRAGKGPAPTAARRPALRPAYWR